eukprot:scaffold3014_cov19-Tisochrysis_lutea.AAC.4
MGGVGGGDGGAVDPGRARESPTLAEPPSTSAASSVSSVQTKVPRRKGVSARAVSAMRRASSARVAPGMEPRQPTRRRRRIRVAQAGTASVRMTISRLHSKRLASHQPSSLPVDASCAGEMGRPPCDTPRTVSASSRGMHVASAAHRAPKWKTVSPAPGSPMRKTQRVAAPPVSSSPGRMPAPIGSP